MSVHYQVKPVNPSAHLLEVRCTVNQPQPEGQVFSMPAWIPGSYMIRDFAKNVVTMTVQAEDRSLAVELIDKQTWRCEPCDAPLTMTYQIYAWDLSVRTAHVDATHAYFNGTSVYICPEGCEQQPCTVELLPPDGEGFENWRVATAMQRKSAELHGFGSYVASDYDELIDHPVEMGMFTLATFEVAGVPHDIAITGRHNADMDRLCRDLKIICEHHVELFGELPEMERYVFQVMAVGEGYGGLEHRASTSLLCSRDDLPKAGDEAVNERYRGFLGLCSHEYFHTWNVKRIKPAVFMPYDLAQESYTRLMWMFEGITSYYDDLSLVRSGLINAESYLELLGQNITRVLRGSGRLKQSVWDSSFYTWTKFYKQDENAPNAIVSYYVKGALIALGLDLTIREKSAGTKSLDDVMRYLWQQYGKTAIGVPEKSIETEITQWLGIDLHDFFEHALRSTDELPLKQWLETVGVDMHLYPAQSADDKGGKLPEPVQRKCMPGARYVTETAGVRLTHVFDNGAAQCCGLSAGDVIIAMDGIRVDAGSFEQKLAGARVGNGFELHAFRRDELMTFHLQATSPPDDTCALTFSESTPAWLAVVD